MSLWPFKKKSLFPPEETTWLVFRLQWLIEEFGTTTNWPNRSLILPDSQSFKTAGKTGHTLAEYVLAQIQEKSGTQFIKIKLKADDPTPGYEGENLVRPVHPDSPAGTYQRRSSGSRIITYNPSLLKQPIQLIATLAHELSHALLDNEKVELPVGSELELELMTDLTAVFLGFGVFMSNTAFEYQQFQDGAISGWSYQRLGYLPQNLLVLATANFVSQKNGSDENAKKHLRPGLAATYEKARKHLDGFSKV